MRTNILTLLFMSLMLVACATKQKILDTSAVSMSHSSIPKGAKMKELGPVRGVFCMETFGKEGEFGLMDEAVKNAHEKTGAEIITSAVFYAEGSCVSVEGDGKTLAKD